MSFSAQVKEELAKHTGNARHCQIAEMTAILCMNGRIEWESIQGEPVFRIYIRIENKEVANKCKWILKKLFSWDGTITEHVHANRNNSYHIEIEDGEKAFKILETTKLLESLLQEMQAYETRVEGQNLKWNPLVLQKQCCKRAFVRGVFLGAGSINNPEKAYHLEVVCGNERLAESLRDIFSEVGLETKIVPRKKYFVLYMKEGAMIVDALNIMEAHVSLMNMENVRILKDMRNSVNRKVNCETANINKTVNAAVKQLEDIRYIEEKAGFGKLKPQLKEIAVLRLEEPEATLKELGEMLNPPVSKSGVNHRLKKLSEIAADLREKNELLEPKGEYHDK